MDSQLRLPRVDYWKGYCVPSIKIRSRSNESIEQMLRRFKKLCEKEGLTKQIKRHSYYEKPSERRRRQTRKAARHAQKTLAESRS